MRAGGRKRYVPKPERDERYRKAMAATESGGSYYFIDLCVETREVDLLITITSGNLQFFYEPFRSKMAKLHRIVKLMKMLFAGGKAVRCAS